MKKLLVISEKTDSEQSNIVSEFLSLQYNYGLYDFNVEKILEDLKNNYSLTVESIEIPYYTLKDKLGKQIVLEFSDDQFIY